MFTNFEWLLAKRFGRARKSGFVSLVSAFAIAGIALGVATLILVTSLMNGIRDEMLNNFIGLDGHINIYPNAKSLELTDALSGFIETQPHVTQLTPRIQGQVMASTKLRALGAQVVGVDAQDLASKTRLTENIVSGSITEFENSNGLIIGARLAQDLGVSVGDKVTLISPEGRATFAGMMPRIKAYPVAAMFKLGMHTLDSSLIVMPYDAASIYFTMPKTEAPSASLIELTVDDPERAPEYAAKLQKELGAPFRVYDWKRTNQSVFSALQVQRNVMFVILTLIILVAAFNIISSLIMMVQNKGREVAILRTMGASKRNIQNIFILMGMSHGFKGTMAGLILGVIAAMHIDDLRRLIESLIGQEILVEDIYFLSTLPTKTDWSEVVVIALIALGLSFLATLYPARRAASIAPAEGVRYG